MMVSVCTGDPQDCPHPSPDAVLRSAERGVEQETERQWWLEATDAGRRGLTVASVLLPALKKEWREAIAAALSHFAAHQICSASKHLVSEERPDGSDDQSFPSAHAVETFSAAASLALSSGMILGLPAATAAACVAYGRVRAEKHHPRDVMVGGALGVTFAWLANTLLVPACSPRKEV